MWLKIGSPSESEKSESASLKEEELPLISGVPPSQSTFGRSGCDDGVAVFKLGECCICQEEDEENSMESPCSCSGSLKICFSYLGFFPVSIFPWVFVFCVIL